MIEKPQRVNVSILDKEYHVACEPEEKVALLAAARDLDSRMRKVRNAGGVIGLERIAVLVGLNLCHELHQCRNNNRQIPEETLHSLVSKIDQALKT